MAATEASSLLVNAHLEPQFASNFGKKTITTFSSFALLINNITGPGLVAICIAYQHGGWFPATFLLLVAALGSVLSAGLLVQTMTRFKGNERFQSRVEFMEMARALFPRPAYFFVFCLFLFNITTSNVSAIVESAQTLDSSILMTFGQACAVEIHPNPGIVCISKSSQHSDSIFGEGIWYFSFGYILLAIISVPIGLWNLEENMSIQTASFFALCILLSQFLLQFLNNGIDPTLLPASDINAGAGVSLGSILFNFAFVVTVPSWVNEKRNDVNISTTLGMSITIGALMFALMGAVGGMAYKFSHGADLLTKLSMPDQWLATRVSAQLFPPLVLVPGIPILSIIVRYNLLENKVCGPVMANIVGVVFPWLISLFTMSGNLLNVILNWSGILTVGPLNFLIPCTMFLLSMRHTKIRKARSMKELPSRKSSDSKASDFGSETRKRRRNSKKGIYQTCCEEDDLPFGCAVFRFLNMAIGGDDDLEGENEIWKFLPFLTDRGSIRVAWVVIVLVSTINILVFLLAIRGIFLRYQVAEPGLNDEPR